MIFCRSKKAVRMTSVVDDFGKTPNCLSVSKLCYSSHRRMTLYSLFQHKLYHRPHCSVCEWLGLRYTIEPSEPLLSRWTKQSRNVVTTLFVSEFNVWIHGVNKFEKTISFAFVYDHKCVIHISHPQFRCLAWMPR